MPVAGLTAWQLLTETAPVQPGQRVLIHAAAGGVGHLAVQIAKYLGAYVIGTASEPKHAWLRGLGVDELIDYRTVRFEEVVKDVDLVIDSLGDKADMTSTRSMQTLRSGGTIVTVPCTSPELRAAANLHNLIAKPFLVEPDGRSLVILADLIDKGHLTVRVEEVFPFKQFAEAHRRLESGRTQGKLVVRMG
ncbi:MAG: NADP-dependent oxidoreductase [Terriglobales bacterium]